MKSSSCNGFDISQNLPQIVRKYINYVFSVVFVYVQPVFILVNKLNKRITTFKNKPPQRREVFVSGDGNCLPSCSSLQRDEIRDKTHGEIPRASDSMFEENPQVFKPQLFSSKGGSCQEKQGHGNPGRNCRYIISCASLLIRPICTYSSSGFSFKPIINASAGSFSSITTKKQCRCFTLVYHDNI